MENFFLAALARASGVGSRQLRKLLDEFENAETVWNLTREELLDCAALPIHVVEAIVSYRKDFPDDPKQLQEACVKQGIKTVSLKEPEYPEILKQISDPPVVIYYKGTLEPAAARLAIVGSRMASPYGEGVAKEFAERLARAGVVPVVVLEKVEDAVPTAQALLDGGIDVMEITFRTAAAADCIREV
ncbi:MAG: DNA-processing protein DprA, partial [Selenomonadaceae bacterium]|nr:DNA-processing protein DprA [Selenomonadaceae bacterium]